LLDTTSVLRHRHPAITNAITHHCTAASIASIYCCLAIIAFSSVLLLLLLVSAR
jgi:hypothetical protein